MAETIKIHEIGKEEKSVSGEIGFIFAREDVEGKSEEEIRRLVTKQILGIGQILFGIVMNKKKEWEGESAKVKKFLLKDN